MKKHYVSAIIFLAFFLFGFGVAIINYEEALMNKGRADGYQRCMGDFNVINKNLLNENKIPRD